MHCTLDLFHTAMEWILGDVIVMSWVSWRYPFFGMSDLIHVFIH